jgi:hypothetical protein
MCSVQFTNKVVQYSILTNLYSVLTDWCSKLKRSYCILTN